MDFSIHMLWHCAASDQNRELYVATTTTTAIKTSKKHLHILYYSYTKQEVCTYSTIFCTFFGHHLIKSLCQRTFYGGRKHTTNGFLFLLLNCCRTSQYRHHSNTDTSILRKVSNVPTKFSYIFFKKKNSLSYRQWTLNLGPRE